MDQQFSSRRSISRTSSQHMNDRNHFTGLQSGQLNSRSVRIQRVGSLSIPPMNNSQRMEEDEIDEINSNAIQENNEEQPEQNSIDHLQSLKVSNYYQMCKDIQFIQMLGNPGYVIQLLVRGYFLQEDFKKYLNSLKCFLRKPELMRLIKYAEGLYTLNLLMKKGFVQSLENQEFRNRFIVDCLKRNLSLKADMTSWRNFDINTIANPNQNPT